MGVTINLSELCRVSDARAASDPCNSATPWRYERKGLASFARDEARPDSDLDLLTEAGEPTTPFFPGGLISDLEDALGRRGDVVEDEVIHESLKDRIHAEAVPLWRTAEIAMSTAISFTSALHA